MNKKISEKLTEDEVVEILSRKLEKDGWKITNQCFGQTKGNDIEATKNGKILIVEAKGAKSNDYSPTKKRESFDGGQIKSHFGRALVKTMSDINKNPQHIYAIAHPDDELIRKTIGHIIPQLEKLNIKHYWVKKDD
jgi:3-phosphoglycerate kinase